MKKMIAALLALAMCLGLCACRSGGEGSQANKPEKTILGQWVAVTGDGVMSFNEDGTATLEIDGGKATGTWKYDKELASYVFAAGMTYNVQMVTENGLEYIKIGNTRFYHPEDREKALPIELEKLQAKVEEAAEGKEKVQFNTPYAVEYGTIEFKSLTLSEESGYLILEVVVTSNRSWDSSNMVPFGGMQVFYYGGSIQNGNAYDWPNVWLTDGEPVTVSATINISGEKDFLAKTLEDWGKIMGILYFEMDGTEYYIDISEYITK